MNDVDYNRKKLEFIRSKLKPVESGCHEWQGYVAPLGYGFVSYRSRARVVHRLLWILVNGDVPRKMDVCHTCDNRKCCNLDHLWVGTRQQNLIDASNKGRVHCQKKTHCPQGHEYSGDALWVDKFGWRHCRICSRARQRLMTPGWSEQEAFALPPIPHTAPRPRRVKGTT